MSEAEKATSVADVKLSERTTSKGAQKGPSLDSLIQDQDLKFVFVGGKGGVGKTTSASAIASQLSFNRKVLLVSTDPAHSLGDAFRIKFSNLPTTIPNLPNLDVMEIDPSDSMEAELGDWAKMAEELGGEEITKNVKGFQEWLSGYINLEKLFV